jgi:hypothetical protein
MQSCQFDLRSKYVRARACPSIGVFFKNIFIGGRKPRKEIIENSRF